MINLFVIKIVYEYTYKRKYVYLFKQGGELIKIVLTNSLYVT